MQFSRMRSGERIRITAQLIDVAADKHMWAQSYEGDLRDTLALQGRSLAILPSIHRLLLTGRNRLR